MFFQIDIGNNFLVAACDGLWDVVEDSAVIKIVTEFLTIPANANDLEGASKKLRDVAFLNGSTDNISVVVLKRNDQ